MALEYALTLAGNPLVEQVAERTTAVPDDRPRGAEGLLEIELSQQYGYDLSVIAGRDKYVAVEGDDGMWEWQPESYALASFRLDEDADDQWSVANMLVVVSRILATGPEDCAFVWNYDYLLFTRLDGRLVKHRREEWWAHYTASNDVIPG